MRLEELKANDIVELRMGKMMMVFVLDGKKVFINYEDYFDGQHFSKEDLKSSFSSKFDIVKVRRPIYPIQLKQPYWNMAKLIWQEEN